MTSRFHARLIGCLQQIKGSGRPQPAVCCRLLAPGSFDASGEADPSKGATFQAAGAERCTPENPSTRTLLLCPRFHPPPVDGKARVPKFRKAVWRDCLQAHWDEEHRGVAMPDATTTAIRLAPDELEWCNILARGGKVKTAKRKREAAAAVAQAEAEEATHNERRVAEGAAAVANAGDCTWASARGSAAARRSGGMGRQERQQQQHSCGRAGRGRKTAIKKKLASPPARDLGPRPPRPKTRTATQKTTNQPGIRVDTSVEEPPLGVIV